MAADKKAGVIYILTNPAFPEYVKIGYTSDLEERLEQLNQSACVPFPFRVHALFDVDRPIPEEDLQSLIASLDPEVRTLASTDGETRRIDFYIMSKEHAYILLENIARMSGTPHRLHRMRSDKPEVTDQKMADEIREDARTGKLPFSFHKCGIPVGARIELGDHPEYVATVADDRHVAYDGKTYSLTALARELLEREQDLQGPLYWTYLGRTLCDLRTEREEEGLYQ